MARRAYDPLAGWGVGAVLLRFLLSAFFGLLLGLLVVAMGAYLWDDLEALVLLACLLVVLPLGAGVAGVFWFDRVVDGLRETIEEAFRH
jgi:hypothetical protein